ncbi:MAG: helix-turn-helix domain-containing protein, partial [Aquificaceae bacterium]
MIVELEIKDLVVPQGLLPRVLTGTVEEKVQEYAEMLEEGVEFDPISVWKRDNQYWVIDGVHRLEAHKRAGKTTIKAKLVDCKDELDYRIKAIQANLKHGLALAKEEKPILAQILYKEGLSEDEIQKVFGVSKSTVYAWLQNIKEEERQEKIRKALELRKRGFTQEQIAKELGVAKSTISTWLQEV